MLRLLYGVSATGTKAPRHLSGAVRIGFPTMRLAGLGWAGLAWPGLGWTGLGCSRCFRSACRRSSACSVDRLDSSQSGPPVVHSVHNSSSEHAARAPRSAIPAAYFLCGCAALNCVLPAVVRLHDRPTVPTAQPRCAAVSSRRSSALPQRIPRVAAARARARSALLQGHAGRPRGAVNEVAAPSHLCHSSAQALAVPPVP